MIAGYRSALVTGGAGFIGSHLVDSLIAAGVETTVVDDLSTGSPERLPETATLVTADIADPRTSDLVAGVGAQLVIHAAAQISVPISVQDPGRDRAVNLVGTEHVLDGASRGGARRFVFISSGGAIYGDKAMADETTVPAPANPYGIHKLAAEGYVRIGPMSWGIVRLSNVYGPRQRAGLEGAVVAVFADALRAGRAVTVHGTGDQQRDFLYVADAVRGILAVAGSERSGTWNVSTGTPTRITALLAELEARLGRASRLDREPSRAGDVQASCLSPARIEADLGWTPAYSLQQGLDDLSSAPDG